MNIPSVIEKLTIAEQQFADEDGAKSIGDLAHIVQIERDDFEPLFNQMLDNGSLPPNPNTPVTASHVGAAAIKGVLIGLRAAQLAELEELESIPTL